MWSSVPTKSFLICYELWALMFVRAMPLWGYQKAPAPSWWACLIKGKIEANVGNRCSTFIRVTGMNSPLIHTVSVPWYDMIILKWILLMHVCTYVCVSGEGERDWERCSPEAFQVKCALYRQLLYILYSCISTVYASILVSGKWADFAKCIKVAPKISWDTTTSHIHHIWVCHVSVNIQTALFDMLTTRFSCLSSPTPYMPPLSLICDERENLQRPQ